MIEVNCIFCRGSLKQLRIGGIYIPFKCKGCNMAYFRRKTIIEWYYLDNRAYSKNYGLWVVCTKEIEQNKRECVVFT